MASLAPSSYIGKSFGAATEAAVDRLPYGLAMAEDATSTVSSSATNTPRPYATREKASTAMPPPAPIHQGPQPVYIVGQEANWSYTTLTWFAGLWLLVVAAAYFYWLSVECCASDSYELNETIQYSLKDLDRIDGTVGQEEEVSNALNVA